MRLHPLAWAGWLTAVCVVAVVVSNPMYQALAIGAVMLVQLAGPVEDTPQGRAVRTFLVTGIVLLVLRLVLVAFVTDPGATTLVTLPRLEVPRWLGGFGVGGRVTLEVLVEGLRDGLRLILVLVAFGVVNARADLAAIVRSVPGSFRDAGLVVSVALAFVPGVLRTAREVRDAQRMRGERGLRTLSPSLAVPVLGSSLERALLLAESMDARGYGRLSAGRPARALVVGGLCGVLGALPVWLAGARTAGSVLAVTGAVVVGAGVAAAARASGVTRMAPPPWTRMDTLVAAASVAAAALSAALGPDARYTAYPEAAVPAFAVSSAAVMVLLAVPGAA